MSNSIIHNEIDVVIPVYNGEKFIIEAIDSAAHQTLSPKKIIIIDDGSTDNTYSLVSEYARYSAVEIKLVQKANGGLSSARNRGIQESDAEFIAFLDADDVWVKEKLEKQLAIYQQTVFRKLGLVYCNYDVINAQGAYLYINYKAPLDKKRMRGSVFKTLLERNRIASSGSGVLIRRSIFNTIGLFDETLKWGEDWDMWLRIAEHYEVDFVDAVLVHIRKHAHNMTANPSKIFEHELHFYKKWMSIIDKRYPIPTFWADKISIRIISQFPKKEFFTMFKNKVFRENQKKLFRKSFGSFFLYLPVFFFRQFFNVLFTRHYAQTAIRLIQHRGK